MEAVIFIGLQASGKSSFYRKRFVDSHIRLNLDMLKTRHREKLLFDACLAAKQPVVIDNTNPTRLERQEYIVSAKAHKFKIIGYYFQSNLEDCQQRNSQRDRKSRIPVVGIRSTAKKLELPNYREGFDKLYYVKLAPNDSFAIATWNEEMMK